MDYKYLYMEGSHYIFSNNKLSEDECENALFDCGVKIDTVEFAGFDNNADKKHGYKYVAIYNDI